MYNKRIIRRKKLGVKNRGQIFLVKKIRGKNFVEKKMGVKIFWKGGGVGKKLAGKNQSKYDDTVNIL